MKVCGEKKTVAIMVAMLYLVTCYKNMQEKKKRTIITIKWISTKTYYNDARRTCVRQVSVFEKGDKMKMKFLKEIALK